MGSLSAARTMSTRYSEAGRGSGAPLRVRSWVPRRLFYRMALGYILGSALFLLGAATARFRDLGLVTDVAFFVGAQIYTVAVCLQLLSAIARWGWQPGRLRLLVAFAFLLGAVLFSVETTVVVGEALGWFRVTYPAGYAGLGGSGLFVVGAQLQVAQACGRRWCARPRETSWWSTVLIALGCLAFLVGSYLILPRER